MDKHCRNELFSRSIRPCPNSEWVGIDAEYSEKSTDRFVHHYLMLITESDK